jgi:hypothetical protein
MLLATAPRVLGETTAYHAPGRVRSSGLEFAARE